MHSVGGGSMAIRKELKDQSLTVSLEGRIDSVTAPELEKELMSATDSIRELILDFAEIDYVSSAGLRMIVALQKRMNQQGSLVILNVRPEIISILEVTGLYKLLNIQEG